jgi:hypothetical protein
VVRVPAEGAVPPPEVSIVRARPAITAQAFEMLVCDPSPRERSGERLLHRPGDSPRDGEAAHVREEPDPVLDEEARERIE